jgi:hypothetical protein
MPAKECPVCEAKIGETDQTCPACGTDLETLQQEIESVERVNKVLENRKKKEVPAPAPQPQPEKKLSIFAKLALKKKKGS